MKEFLSARAVGFVSCDIDNDAEARRRFEALGLADVPTVAADGRAAPGVDLAQVAALLELPFAAAAPSLPPLVLVERLRHALETAMRLAAQLPSAGLAARLPNRDRTCLGLANHIVEIAAGYLQVAAGSPFDARTSASAADRDLAPEALAGRCAEIVEALAAEQPVADAPVAAFFGPTTLHWVLERCAWHAAQHVRQLAMMLTQLGIVPDRPLGDADLAGLPLPAAVWD